MKKLILLLFFAPLSGYAQDYFTGDKCTMEEVVQVDGVPAAELYARSKFVLAKIFKSAQDVTQLDDEKNAQVVAKGLTYVRMKNPFNPEGGQVRFSFQIQCKDGRYKYIISDCYHESNSRYKYAGGTFCNDKPDCGTLLMPKVTWVNLKKDFISQMELVIADMKKQMANESSNNKNSEW